MRVDGLREACETSVRKVGEDLESVRSEVSALSALEDKVDKGIASVREELERLLLRGPDSGGGWGPRRSTRASRKSSERVWAPWEKQLKTACQGESMCRSDSVPLCLSNLAGRDG